MKGTALLINKDNTVTVLENVEHKVYKELINQEDSKEVHCIIGEKEITFNPFSAVIWHEEQIDWDYGY
ncbi:hypothetical protein [Pseudogracilibacillus sp. SO30301A]|uniref:hypothetical protein n=1 Tax=Pseudogracilibacillus sp. SO30301A TaxID=3098291 RepID=UPI00300E09CE